MGKEREGRRACLRAQACPLDLGCVCWVEMPIAARVLLWWLGSLPYRTRDSEGFGPLISRPNSPSLIALAQDSKLKTLTSAVVSMIS